MITTFNHIISIIAMWAAVWLFGNGQLEAAYFAMLLSILAALWGIGNAIERQAKAKEE